jgi:glycosyltransferase involved in cell wall biosynthesis
MHIAIDVHSIGSRAAGNETYYQQLVRGLAEFGSAHQFTLFYTHPEAPRGVPASPQFVWEKIPQNRILRLGFSLPRRIREIAPDIFHCQYIAPARVSSKLVVTIHDLAHEHHPGLAHPLETLAMRKLVRATAQRADRILTVSHFCAADIAGTYGISAEKILVASPAISTEFHPRDKAWAQGVIAHKYAITFPFILFVGRLQARKNLVRLLEAYAQLMKQAPTPKLLMIGKPDWGVQQIQQTIERLDLGEHVILPGYVASEDLPLFYNAAELFVFPSLFEGFGLPVLESMASGLPTITSRGSSLQEVAGDGALSVDPLSVDCIAQAMLQVLSDESLRCELVARGLRRSQDFTLRRFTEEVMKAYAQ